MIFENYNLKNYNTFHLDVNARYFVELTNLSQINEIKKFIDLNSLNYLVLGGGSNILFRNDFDGLIILNQIKGIEISYQDDDYVYLKVGAGENWHQFVKYTVENEFYGLENLALIPGNVGAAPVQNIGAYGVEQEHYFDFLDAFNLETNELLKIDKEECKFGYRDSIFKNELKEKCIITYVYYKLPLKSVFSYDYKDLKIYLDSHKLEINQKNIFNAVVNIRNSKLPNPEIIGNCGSFFKNPIINFEKFKEVQRINSTITGYYVDKSNIKIPAAMLIEKAGLKGKIYNGAAVSPNHALVLINYNNATGMDVFELSELIIAEVFQKFGVLLQREVNII